MTKGSWCDLEHTKPFVCCVTVYSLSTRFVTGVTVVTPAHVYVRETLWLFTTRYCVYILFIKWREPHWIQILPTCSQDYKYTSNELIRVSQDTSHETLKRDLSPSGIYARSHFSFYWKKPENACKSLFCDSYDAYFVIV